MVDQTAMQHTAGGGVKEESCLMDGLMDGKKLKYSMHIQIKVYNGIPMATKMIRFQYTYNSLKAKYIDC